MPLHHAPRQTIVTILGFWRSAQPTPHDTEYWWEYLLPRPCWPSARRTPGSHFDNPQTHVGKAQNATHVAFVVFPIGAPRNIYYTRPKVSHTCYAVSIQGTRNATVMQHLPRTRNSVLHLVVLPGFLVWVYMMVVRPTVRRN